jgi:hypothetical protein
VKAAVHKKENEADICIYEKPFSFLMKVKMVFSCGCSEAGKLGIIKIFGKNN